MRITGGILRGREITVPKSGVRPTQDRVRAALFSILAERIAGSRFLDLFAGSGSVGLEAWSRGAEVVYWVEADRRIRSVLQANVERLCDARATIVGADAVRFLKKRLVAPGFDIIFSDPPYNKLGKSGELDELLDALRESDLLRPGGLFIMEQGAGEGFESREGWKLADHREYGETRLRFFRRTES